MEPETQDRQAQKIGESAFEQKEFNFFCISGFCILNTFKFLGCMLCINTKVVFFVYILNGCCRRVLGCNPLPSCMGEALGFNVVSLEPSGHRRGVCLKRRNSAGTETDSLDHRL